MAPLREQSQYRFGTGRAFTRGRRCRYRIGPVAPPGRCDAPRMTRERVDCVVIGAGAAGLAASGELQRQGIEHVVLDRGRVGEVWRSQRWDTFRLNTPGWQCRMLGEVPADAYLTAPQLVERLVALPAAEQVREHVTVMSMQAEGSGFRLETTDGDLRSRSVVVASGQENVPRIPSLASSLPGEVFQCHSADYRCPEQLPAGTALVVGSGQSGCQITNDLLAAGRTVLLASSRVGWVPLGYRGLDVTAIMDRAGFFDQRPADVPAPRMLTAPQPVLAPAGRPLNLRILARAGARLTGRVVDVDADSVRFDDSVQANLAAGDAFAAQVRQMLDQAVDRMGLPAAARRTPDDEPALADFALNVPTSELAAVVWCPAYDADFGWLPADLLDTAGWPRHDGTAAPLPGWHYLGLRWLTHRASAIIPGFSKDAASIARALLATLGTPS
jgi:putative flavoprotein involved in K+ transport